MSWLRDHFYKFVFPAMMMPEKDANLIGNPVDVKESASAPKNLPSELRKLWTLCKDLGVKWSDDIKEYSEYGGSSIHRKNAQMHGRILRSTLDSSLVAMRAEKKSKLFLAGRDVWALAVLAERRGIPYVFVPEISRMVADSPAVVPLLQKYGVNGDEILIDTGFAGSIPKGLAVQTGREVPFRLMSQSAKHIPGLASYDSFGRFNVRKACKTEIHPEQLFPNRKKARAEALETEYLAKYWKTGTTTTHRSGDHRPKWNPALGRYDAYVAPTEPDRVIQYLANRENIQRAALMTSHLWRGVL